MTHTGVGVGGLGALTSVFFPWPYLVPRIIKTPGSESAAPVPFGWGTRGHLVVVCHLAVRSATAPWHRRFLWSVLSYLIRNSRLLPPLSSPLAPRFKLSMPYSAVIALCSF